MRAHKVLLLVTLLALVFSSAHSVACNVPVFRYALERWHSDGFSAYVLHPGPLSGRDKEVYDIFDKYVQHYYGQLQIACAAPCL